MPFGALIAPTRPYVSCHIFNPQFLCAQKSEMSPVEHRDHRMAEISSRNTRTLVITSGIDSECRLQNGEFIGRAAQLRIARTAEIATITFHCIM